MSRFDDAFERVQKLVHDFEANEAYYLSAGYQESEVRTDFIDKFWNALGWDVRHKFQTNPREQEVKVEKNPDANATGRRADYAFYYKPDYRNPVFFVEAKKPSVKLHGPKGYHQILKYGKNAGTPIGVLMDFEEFHIVDCRYLLTEVECYPLAKIKSFHYKDFLDKEKFGDIYWIFSHEALEEGKLKAFTSSLPKLKGKGKVKIQAEAEKPIDEAFLATLEEYRLILAKAFKKADESLTAEELTEATQKVIDRLVFIRFLEDKNIEADYIVDQIAAKKGSAWKSFLAWSKELDVKYNGIVFKPNRIDSPAFNAPDDAVFSKLCEDISHQHSPYLFSYIPIEILGSIYERFLGKVVTATAKRADIEEKPEVRKAGGVYYTPKYIVEYIVANTVGKILSSADFQSATPEGRQEAKETGRQTESLPYWLSPQEVAKLRFADIACGSGSFLIAVYDAVLRHVEAYYNAHPDEARKAKCIEIDKDVFALSLAQKRQILLDNIFGVDIDNQAVEVAQLSLFLKLLESESGSLAGQLTFERTKILPDLSKNILCGNSLIEYDIEQLFPLTSDDAHRIKPFDFRSSFKEIMSKGGFDAIVGNPPYEILLGKSEKENKGELTAISTYMKEKYDCVEGEVNLYKVFTERAIKHVLKPNGYFGYIMPTSILNDKSTKKLRTMLLENFQGIEVSEFPEQARVFKNVTQGVCIYILSNQFSGIYLKSNILSDLELLAQIPIEVEKSMLLKAGKFPLFKSQGEFLLFSHLTSLPTFKDTNVVSFIEGEIHLTKFKDAILSESNSNSIQLVRGDIVSRYSLSNESKKDSLVDPKIVYQISNSPKLDDIKLDRLVYQQVVNIQKARRMNFMSIDNNIFVGNTCGYVKLSPNSNYNLKFFLGLLNSSLLNWRYKLTSSNNHILTNELYDLPFPTLDLTNATERGQHDKMVSLVEQMLEAKKRLAAARTDSEKTQAERKCEYLDNEIDTLVYELYGLTAEEVGIVEGV